MPHKPKIAAYNHRSLPMFERFTEKARRVIFFARYEASQYGSPTIEPEHLLLGILREDKALTNRLSQTQSSVEAIRKQIEGHNPVREHIATSVDLPLADDSKRILAYAAQEAERLGHRHIGTEHILLGILREKDCFAAQLLTERNLKLPELRDLLQHHHAESARANPTTAGIGASAGGLNKNTITVIFHLAGSEEPLLAFGNYMLLTQLPRIGDSIALGPSGPRYRVADVTWVYAPPPPPHLNEVAQLKSLLAVLHDREEHAIANHEFEKARSLNMEHRDKSDRLAELRAQHNLPAQPDPRAAPQPGVPPLLEVKITLTP